MAKMMLAMAGSGADLRDLLMRELNVPPRAKWFEVRFGAGEAVTVRCEFFAQEREEEIPEVEEPSGVPNHGGLNG